MYRIRLHGRGGQGIKTASQILGSAFFLAGYEVQDAPRYGAERRGAPIFAYVRAARTPIFERGVITRPDLVIVADETLVPIPAAGVLEGMCERTVLLINSETPAQEWRTRLNLEGPIFTVPVTPDIALRADLSFIGARCAGAGARLTGVIERQHLEQAIRGEIDRYGEPALSRNLEHALVAFDAMSSYAGAVVEGVPFSAVDYEQPDWIEMPLEDASVAAPDIHASLTSELVRTGVWRTQRPVIDYEHCNRCSWVCSTLCPDSAILVEADRTPRIDYDHCKGCLVCVAVCPPHAIRAIPERGAEEVRKQQ